MGSTLQANIRLSTGKTHAPYQYSETGIRAQAIEERFDVEQAHLPIPCALALATFSTVQMGLRSPSAMREDRL